MIPYAAGDWFAVPLRLGLFAVGRAAAVDTNGVILGYFFARFFERVPAGTDVLALTPGEADLIGVCDRRCLRNGEWPRIAPAGARDVRRWTIPVFRTIDPASGEMSWFTYEPANLTRPIGFEREPREAGLRNWGLSMLALEPVRMSPETVEFALWYRFRDFQNQQHRKYIADMQGSAAPSPWRSAQQGSAAPNPWRSALQGSAAPNPWRSALQGSAAPNPWRSALRAEPRSSEG